MKHLKILFLACATLAFSHSTVHAAKTANYGEVITLGYSSTYVTSCTAISGPAGYPQYSVSPSTSGSFNYTAGNSGTFTLTCTPLIAGYGTTVSASDTLTVLTPTGDIKANNSDGPVSCTIPVGQGACSPAVTISFTTQNTSFATVWVAGAAPMGGTSGSAPISWITFGSWPFELRNGSASNGTLLDTVTVNASCAAGSTWNGGSCVGVAEPTISATCTQNGALWNVNLSWNAVSGATNYPMRINGPPDPTSTTPSYPIGKSGTTNVVGWGVVGDAPTGTSLSFNGLTAGGSYTYWGHAWNSAPSPGGTWSSATNRTVNCLQSDLTAGAITPTSVTAGTNVLFSSTVSNTGSASTGAGFTNLMQYSLSSDGSSPVDSGTQSMTTKAAGASGTFSVTGATPAPMTIYLRACADKASTGDAGTISESNESNNCGPWTPVVVSCPVGQAWNGTACAVTSNPTGDIKANNLDSGATCTIPSGGSNCSGTISWTTQNATNASVWIGAANPATGTTGSFTVGWLGYGANTFNLHNTTSQSGTLLDTVIITGTCASGSTWNGSSCVVNTYPDLTAGSITPTTATVGVAKTFSVTVTNQGGSSTGAGFTVLYQQATTAQGGAPVADSGTSPSGTIAAGSSAVITESYTFPQVGNYYIRACADKSSAGDAGVINENTNEGNNCGAWTTIVVSPATGASCSAMGTQTWLTNCSASVPGVADGGQSVVSNTASGYTGSATWSCTNGSWSGPTNTSCTADTGPVTISVRATSPLKVTPSSAFSFPFSYTISDDSTNGRCHLLDSNSAELTAWTAMTSPNSIAWTAPASNGQYTYYVECRKGSSSVVVDKDNVTVRVCPVGLVWGAVSGACVPPSDLTAGSVTPLTAPEDVTTVFSSTISNTGAGSTEGSFKNFLQWADTNPDTDPDPDIKDINDTTMSTLAAGASATATGSRRYNTAGTYYMRACADKDKANDTGDIDESNENNNCGVWTEICIGTTAQCTVTPPGPPAIVNPTLGGNHTSSGTLSFSCTNTLTYSIIRDGIFLVNNQPYTAPISNYPISTAGNYTMRCTNGTNADSVVAYDPAPIASSNISLTATPRSIVQNGKVTLQWGITSPNSSCRILATAICTGSCDSAHTNAAAALQTILDTSSTDSNDPFGASRVMKNVADTGALEAPYSGNKAAGKKTLQVMYSTDFKLQCGSSAASSTIRVIVTSSTEG
jgi:hypothetical protein